MAPFTKGRICFIDYLCGKVQNVPPINLHFMILENLLNQMATRRSVRRYTAEQVSDECLQQLLTAAERTQTMGNLQLYSVVITRSDEMKQRLAPCHFNQPMVTEAPVVLTFCADYARVSAWCRHRSAEPGYENFLSFVNTATDALLYCQTFCTLAEAAGLGLCFLGTTIYQPNGIIDALHLPELVMPVATITLGYPDEHLPQTDRLPITAIMHQEHYALPTLEDINRDYAAKEALPENLKFTRENGKQTLAQVYTDVRYTQQTCEAMSKELLSALRRQKFL